MNLLAHAYLARVTRTSPAGALLGDRVRGRLKGDFPPGIELGIQLHRSIDSFTDRHPATRQACAAFEPPVRRFAGILCDIYFDHVLASRWHDWSDEKLPDFCMQTQQQVRREWSRPPFEVNRLDGLAELLLGYRYWTGVERSIDYIASRGRRARMPAQAYAAVRDRSRTLDAAFDQLFPDLVEFAHCETTRLQQNVSNR